MESLEKENAEKMDQTFAKNSTQRHQKCSECKEIFRLHFAMRAKDRNVLYCA
jgi:hypothetical protein